MGGLKEGDAVSTGIVIFRSLRAKTAAMQCRLAGNPDNMIVKDAPSPDSIIWRNISMPLFRQRLLGKQSSILWLAGILFWAVPVAFVIGVANLNAILSAVGLPTANSSSGWYGLISGLLPPVFLALLMIFLYKAITFVATSWVRYKSQPEVDEYVFFWHQLFQFANLWLLLIGGSLFGQVSTIADDPTGIVDAITAALPGAAIFFANYILVATFGSWGLELSMLPTYGVTLLKSIFQSEEMRTQRELDESKKTTPIDWGKKLPPMVFQFLIVLVYMPIAPIIVVFGLLFFAGTYLVQKHQCMHVYAQENETGGLVTWQKLSVFLFVSLYMAEIIFIAYMGTKKAPLISGLGFVPSLSP